MMRASPDGTGRNMWTEIGLPLFLSAMLFALGVAPAAAAPKGAGSGFPASTTGSRRISGVRKKVCSATFNSLRVPTSQAG